MAVLVMEGHLLSTMVGLKMTTFANADTEAAESLRQFWKHRLVLSAKTVGLFLQIFSIPTYIMAQWFDIAYRAKPETAKKSKELQNNSREDAPFLK